MSLELNHQEKLLEIEDFIKREQCPHDIATIKGHVKLLKEESKFYLASKLLKQARGMQQQLRPPPVRRPNTLGGRTMTLKTMCGRSSN